MVLITIHSQARSHLFCHCMRPRKTLSINAINFFIAITQMLFINYTLRNFSFCFFLYTMIKVHDHSISWHCNEVFFANSHCLLAAISANKMIDNFNSALSPCVEEKMDFSFCQKNTFIYKSLFTSHILIMYIYCCDIKTCHTKSQ